MAWRWYEMTDKNEVITIPDKLTKLPKKFAARLI